MEYTIRIKSPLFQYLITFLFCAIIFPFLPIAELPYIISMLLMMSIGAIGLWIGAKLTKGIAKIQLNDDTFEIIWLKRASFSTLKDTSLKLENLNGWKYRKENGYNYFILYNTKEQQLIFYRDDLWNPDKDDFGKFLIDFEKTIQEYNKQEKIKTKESSENDKVSKPKLIIDKEASFQNSSLGRLVFYVYIATLIFGIYALITKWEELDYRRIFIIGLLGACIGFILDHLNKRKKNSS
jgi:hypothetical protein